MEYNFINRSDSLSGTVRLKAVIIPVFNIDIVYSTISMFDLKGIRKHIKHVYKPVRYLMDITLHLPQKKNGVELPITNKIRL